MVTHSASTPLYQQIRYQILHDIDTGIYCNGDKLPSERELCEKYGVSRISVRKALSLLEAQGIVHSVQGKGSFISAPVISNNLSHFSSFADDLSRRGYEGFTKLVDYFPHSPDHSYDVILNCLEHGSSQLILLGYANSCPVAYFDSIIRRPISSSFYEEACAAAERENAFSTYDLYGRLDIHIGHVSQRVLAVNAEESLARMLEVPVGGAVLLLESLILDVNMEPIEYKRDYYRTDKFSFNLNKAL